MNNVGSLLVQKAYHQRSPGRSDRRKIFNAERKEIASAMLATARTPQLQKRFEISRLGTPSYIEIPPRILNSMMATMNPQEQIAGDCLKDSLEVPVEGLNLHSL